MTRDIFISHAGDDSGVAAEVCALLEKRGVKCWIAPRDVDAGSVWDEAILDAIEQSRTFLLILSAHANDSQFVKNEVNRAFSQRKPIVTFRIEDVTPGRSLELYLARHHWTDAFPPPLGARVDRLASSITALLAATPSASVTATAGAPRATSIAPAPVPQSSGSKLFARLVAQTRGIFNLVRSPSFAGAVLLGLIVGGLAIWNLKPAAPPNPKIVSRYTITPPPGLQLGGQQGSINGYGLAISRDGSRIVYTARQGSSQQLYLRPLNSLESTPIPGTDRAEAAFFSPDGQWLTFASQGALMKVPLNGGPTDTLVEGLGQVVNGGGTGEIYWSRQGTIYLGGSFSLLWQVPEAGGNPQKVGKLEKGESGEYDPFPLPDGKNLLFVSSVGSGTGGSAIGIRSLATGETRKLIFATALRPRYVSPGYIVFATGGNLMAVPFDLKRLTVSGTPVPVVGGILENDGSIVAYFDISDTGTLVYIPGTNSIPLRLVWVDRKGIEQPVNAPPHTYVLPRISPDGQRVVAGIEEAEPQIWTYDFSRDALTRLTFQGKTNVDPIWTPDGKRVAYKGDKNRLFWQAADGSGNAEEMTSSPLGTNNVPGGFSPDGQNMLFTYDGGGGPRQIWILPLKDRKIYHYDQDSSNYETAPRFSPDGHWIAYVSRESGRYEVYVRPYPGPGGKWQVSSDGGTEPVWNPKGHELFFRNGKKMMTVEYSGDQPFSAEKPKQLFEGDYVLTPRSFPDYDVSPDGQKFLMLKTALDQQQAASQINVVENWVEELKQKIPLGNK